MALGGSCCSSCCSTRNSRDRWLVRAADVLAATARAVGTTHALLALGPPVQDSDALIPSDQLSSWCPDAVRGAKAASPDQLCPWPRPCPADWLAEADTATESAVPTVLV